MTHNDSNNSIFPIHAYGRTELAQQYFPHLTPDAAWRKLHGWIELNPTLRSQLDTNRQLRKKRTFTPREVRAIIDFLGEP